MARLAGVSESVVAAPRKAAVPRRPMRGWSCEALMHQVEPDPAEMPLGMAPRARPMPFAYLIAVTVHTEVVASSAFVRSRLNCSSMPDS